MVDNVDYWEYSSEYAFSVKLHNGMECVLSWRECKRISSTINFSGGNYKGDI